MRPKIILTDKRNNNEISLVEGFENFIRAKKAKNLSVDSIRNYADSFKYFCAVVVEDNYCSNISIEDFYVFIEALKSRNANISDKTIETYMRHLRAIFYFFMAKGYMDSFKIEMPKYTEESKDPFTDEDIAKLLKRPDF